MVHNRSVLSCVVHSTLTKHHYKLTAIKSKTKIKIKVLENTHSSVRYKRLIVMHHSNVQSNLLRWVVSPTSQINSRRCCQRNYTKLYLVKHLPVNDDLVLSKMIKIIYVPVFSTMLEVRCIHTHMCQMAFLQTAISLFTLFTSPHSR